MVNFSGITLVGEHVMVGIPRADVEGKKLTTLRKALHMCKQKGKAGRGTFHMFIDGYNYDDRELHEIKEVRQFVKLAIEKHPEIFYYTSKGVPESDTDKWLMACYADKIFSYQSDEDRLTAQEVVDKVQNGEEVAGYDLYVEYNDGRKTKLIQRVVEYALSLGDGAGAVEIVGELSRYRM